MGAFIYKAIDGNGASTFGELSAASLDRAIERLAADGLTPIAIDAKKHGLWARINEPVELSRRTSLSQLATLTRSMARLLSAGMNLERALQVIRDSLPAGNNQALVGKLLQGVQKGESLAGVMVREKETFPLYYVNMVRAGELSGSLGKTFGRLSVHIDRTLKFRREILSALIYPAILLVMIALTLILVVTVVLPEFQLIFASAGLDLPLPTRIVMGIGELITGWWWLGVLVLLGLIGGSLAALREPKTRLGLDRFTLRIRLIGSLVGRADLVRFSRTLGTMLDQGVALDDGWEVAARIPKNMAIRADLLKLLSPLKEGGRIAHILGQLSYVPPVARQLVSVGEETGRLGPSLGEVADILEEEQELILKRLLNVFTPAVTLILGGIVAAFIGSVLLGILSINDLAI